MSTWLLSSYVFGLRFTPRDLRRLGDAWCELEEHENAGANEQGQWYHNRRRSTGLMPWPDVVRALLKAGGALP